MNNYMAKLDVCLVITEGNYFSTCYFSTIKVVIKLRIYLKYLFLFELFITHV